MVAILFSSLATTIRFRIFPPRQDRSIVGLRAAIARAETLAHSQLARIPRSRRAIRFDAVIGIADRLRGAD